MIHMNLNLRPDLVKAEPLPGFAGQSVAVDCLRLDRLHPVVSGNKWFKLQGWLQASADPPPRALLTFGGAYSNHILATAYAANSMGLSSIGIIRGEAQELNSITLREAASLGMEIRPGSRTAYRNFQNDPAAIPGIPPQTLIIPEGGSGLPGIRGAATILDLLPERAAYSHICLALGTGTTLAGILQASAPHQQVIGISSLKGKDAFTPWLRQRFPEAASRCHIFMQYHGGGYARFDPELLGFMNSIYRTYGLPTDFVYTAKALLALQRLAQENYFPTGAKLLFIHTGGLQGNRGLPAGSLIFL